MTRNEIKKIKIIYKKIEDITPYINNPRKNDGEALEKVASSIKEFGFKNPIVIDKNNTIINGHTRYKAAKKLGMEEVPTISAEDLTPAQIKAFRIADNKTSEYSEWDEDLLKIELEELKELDFNLDETGFGNDELDCLFNIENNEECDNLIKEENEKQENAEKLINEAWKMQVKEYKEQFDILCKNGYTFSGITKGLATIKFIECKYYNKDYPRYLSLAFHPQQFKTSGDSFSVYEGLERILSNEINVERLRFVTDNDITKLPKGSLAFSGAKMPLDFPVDLAKKLINEFGRKGNILDPCHGWGARLIGSLLNDVNSYTGIDASDLQNKGVNEIWNAFKNYTETKNVKLINSPFEKIDLDSEKYDFALTSPPYFDREKYLGGEQCHLNYSNYEIWRESFYRKLIENVYKALKNDCYFALQVGSQVYPLLEDGKKIAEQVGFEIVEVRSTDMKNNFNKTCEEKSEVILILRKE